MDKMCTVRKTTKEKGYTHRRNLANNTWGQNRPWVLRTLIYEAVKRRFLIFSPSSYHPNNGLENISIS
jgi:hypothetical protein